MEGPDQHSTDSPARKRPTVSDSKKSPKKDKKKKHTHHTHGMRRSEIMRRNIEELRDNCMTFIEQVNDFHFNFLACKWGKIDSNSMAKIEMYSNSRL